MTTFDTTVATVTQKGGVDMYGLYAEGVLSYKSGSIHTYRRAFLVGNNLYRYDRQPGKKSTIWKGMTLSTPDVARERFFRYFSGSTYNCSMRGEPLLVQLKLTDILEMEKGKAPASRYVGGAKIDAAIGKFDEAAWEAETAKRAGAPTVTPGPTTVTIDGEEVPGITSVAFTPITPTSPKGVDKSLPVNWKELLND